MSTQFKVNALDLESFNALPDSENSSRSSAPRYLRNPGTYQLEITSFTMRADDMHRDGAGKQWGSLQLDAKQVGTGYQVRGFLDVPLETLVHTSKSGVPTKVKTNIFQDFIQAVTGNRPQASGIASAVNALPELLNGAVITARVGYKSDYVSYEGKDDNGTTILGLRTKKGDAILNGDGDALKFTSRDEAVEYYKTLKGYKPATSLTIIGFNKPTKAE